jgi:hypothetical protein
MQISFKGKNIEVAVKLGNLLIKKGLAKKSRNNCKRAKK